MPGTLELFLLDSGCEGHVVALGRCNGHVAIERIPLDEKCREFVAYRTTLDGVVLGRTERPTRSELRAFGVALYAWLFRGELGTLYDHVPDGSVSLQVLSNRPQLKMLPWEYLELPNHPAPHRDRCVVRVLPTCGVTAPAPLPKSGGIRVLFVSADPVDQSDVPWPEVQASIERAYQAQLPGRVQLRVVEGATREALSRIIQQQAFDVFHFFGHGTIRDGEGALVLVNPQARRSDCILASDLAALLSGRGVRLAVLSACLTGAGDAADDFSNVATALLRSKIPAVVANQVSIPTKSVAAFVGSLYASLLGHGNIDQAVTDGRVQLAVDLGGTTGSKAVIEWGIPVLYRLCGASVLFA